MAYVVPCLICLMPALALVGCLSSDSATGPDTDLATGPEIILDLPDDEGNLVIRNDTGQRVVLFRGEDLLKIIPDNFTDYLVDVPNPSGVAVDLRIYLLSDIESVLDSPGTSRVLKRWAVVLSTDNEEEHRSTWYVKYDSNETDAGTLELRYAGGTDYSVDVYLDSRNGAKIASLRPGAETRQVGIDYGNYTLLYSYWFSDPNSAEGLSEIGWTDTEIVNEDEVKVYLILNDKRPRITRQVPHFGVQANPWGRLTVKNPTSLPVQLWARSQLIENIVYADGSTSNLSTIEANEVAVFILPTGPHVLQAKRLTGDPLGQVSIEISEGSSYTWDVSSNEITGNVVIEGQLPE
jgi:hypothetical protein